MVPIESGTQVGVGSRTEMGIMSGTEMETASSFGIRTSSGNRVRFIGTLLIASSERNHQKYRRVHEGGRTFGSFRSVADGLANRLSTAPPPGERNKERETGRAQNDLVQLHISCAFEDTRRHLEPVHADARRALRQPRMHRRPLPAEKMCKRLLLVTLAGDANS
ncbi:hypothetical protein EVAR_32393_1 [Eumeta japonica]|uniref:Uncharacterized protein n=1 Tax=Eumeta variegata TaxID=151549 RepID=A0A4C1VKR0_EUMVA|nr:hypothetical protein EVAR_32393_1 [Eumeta japonica]